MRTVLSLAMLAFVLTGCGATGDTKSRSDWNRTRLMHASPSGSAAPRPSPAGTPTPSRTPAPSPTATPTARKAVAVKRVGALFFHDLGGDHYCTASAVESPGHNLIITAAHCLHSGQGGGYFDDLVFVPGYHDGDAPYGVWKVTEKLVDSRWVAHSDPDLDFGFAIVAPLHGRKVADVLGANTLGVNLGFRNVVRVTGYPMNSSEPITCENATTQAESYQMRFACEGYFSGTSGSPWLADYDPATHKGEVVGVIGGYHAGGYADTVSYSSYFDDDVKRLYDEAVRRSASQ